MKKTSIKDVAGLAGVSYMTVTRTLNNHSYVSRATREKVLDACEKLNYRPNRIASSLRTSKSHAIGVVVPTFRVTFYSRFMHSIEAKCSKKGYHIIAVQSQGSCPGEDYKSSLDWSHIEFLLQRKIDGLIIVGSCPDLTARLKKERVPMVFVDADPGDRDLPFLGTNDFEGARALTNYLIEKGHRKIAFIKGHKGSYTGEERFRGYKKALAEHGLQFNAGLCASSNYNLGGGYKAAGELAGAGFTALIGANDYVAIGAMSALKNRGVKVPADVSVAGFAGDEISGYVDPPLTTMIQPIEEIGVKSLEVLFERMRNPAGKAERFLFEAELLEGKSVIEVPGGKQGFKNGGRGVNRRKPAKPAV